MLITIQIALRILGARDGIRLKAERSGEGDTQIQEIAFTASDGNGGEMQGGGGDAVRCKTVCCKYINDV